MISEKGEMPCEISGYVAGECFGIEFITELFIPIRNAKMFNKMIKRAAAVLTVLVMSSQCLATASSFVDPGGWSVGDLNTTYQEWDLFVSPTGNLPDVGHTVSPAISSDPTIDALAPGFNSGSGNFYSFAGDYGFMTEIYNHGGRSGVGGLPFGSGTHVIVQTSATLNGNTGVYANTLELVDAVGDPIVGGANANALRHDVIFEGIVSSTFGDVYQREEIWEFYLPGFVDDFRVQADVIVHSSFDQLRVDTAISGEAYPTTSVVIPEPSSILAPGSLGVLSAFRRKN